MEGSSYEGFMLRDIVHFGDEHDPGKDSFNFTFGCVTKETKLFYSQEVDGILGLDRATDLA